MKAIENEMPDLYCGDDQSIHDSKGILKPVECQKFQRIFMD